jgi:hypothetical protein
MFQRETLCALKRVCQILTGKIEMSYSAKRNKFKAYAFSDLAFSWTAWLRRRKAWRVTAAFGDANKDGHLMLL